MPDTGVLDCNYRGDEPDVFGSPLQHSTLPGPVDGRRPPVAMRAPESRAQPPGSVQTVERWPEAGAAYKRASELAPAGAWAQLAAGHALEAAGLLGEAREYSREVGALYPAAEEAIEGFEALQRLGG